MKSTALGSFFTGLIFAPALMAQAEPGNLSLIYTIRAKAGMEKRFEEAIKKHAAWHRSQNDSRSYHIFSVAYGAGAGSYIAVYPGVRMADLDKNAKLEQADTDDYLANVAQFTDSFKSEIASRLAGLSTMPVTAPVKPLAVVTFYHLRAGKSADWTMFARALKEAADKTSPKPEFFVSVRTMSDELPSFALVRPVNQFAEMTPIPVNELLTKAYGAAQAANLLQLRDSATHCLKRSILVHRPDLSYAPGK